MFSTVFLTLSTILALSFSTRANVSSPKASVDLICPTSDASQCYPRIFQPSDTFQSILDGQEVPPGLHYRLDLTTGKKEAKLNILDENDGYVVQTVDASPVNDAPIVPHDLASVSQDLNDQQVLKIHDGAGSIRPPKSSSDESQIFGKSLSLFRSTPISEGDKLLSTVETLEDLSHDIHWGLKLTEEPGVVHKLIELLNFNQTNTRLRGAAVLLFGTAIQNNPAALSAALSHFYNDEMPDKPMEAIFMALLHDQLPQLLTRFVYLLSALAQDQNQLIKFMSEDGTGLLIRLFDSENTGQDEKDRLRGKIANFVLDRLLQQDSLGSLDRVPRSIEDEKEVESSLEHEDGWVWTDRNESDHALGHQQTVTQLNMAKTLKPWCSSFSTSIRKWDSKKKELGIVAAAENVQEAYEALQAKLKALGCGCDDDCRLQGKP